MQIKKSIILTVIILVMFNNVEHLSFEHYQLARKVFPVLSFDWINKLHSILVVIIFEVVVITFVMAGKKGFSKFFTFCIFLLSMIYYEASMLFMSGKWVDLLAATIYSLIYSISIYMFSEMLNEWLLEQKLEKRATQLVEELKTSLNKYKTKCNDQNQAIINLENSCQAIDYDNIQKDKKIQDLTIKLSKYETAAAKAAKALQCPYCKQPNESEAQLRSHKGHCPQNPKNH